MSIKIKERNKVALNPRDGKNHRTRRRLANFSTPALYERSRKLKNGGFLPKRSGQSGTRGRIELSGKPHIYYKGRREVKRPRGGTHVGKKT